MLDAGECLVDNIEVQRRHAEPTWSLNPDFEQRPCQLDSARLPFPLEPRK